MLLVLPAIGMPQTAATRWIDAYVRSVDTFVRRHPTAIIVADIAEYDSGKPEWRRFPSESELAKFRESSETYTVAYNYRKSGKIVASNFTRFSPSGDWAKYLSHYFREDGSLAKVSSELRTFYGDLIIQQEFYFNARGKRIKKSIKYLDLTTQKPKKPAAEYIEGMNEELDRADYYLTVKSLPFVRLLKPPR